MFENVHQTIGFFRLVLSPQVKGKHNVEKREGMPFIQKNSQAVFKLEFRKLGFFRIFSREWNRRNKEGEQNND
jgi:hypothetical protein